MTEFRPSNRLRGAQANARRLMRTGEMASGIAMGISRNRSSILQVIWWKRHQADLRFKHFEYGSDRHGPLLRTLIRQPDGKETAMDTMVMRGVRGLELRGGQEHLVTTGDSTEIANMMHTRGHPHQLHQVGRPMDPEVGIDGTHFRRIGAAANFGVDRRRNHSAKHVAVFTWMARGLHPSDNPMQPLAVRPFSGTFKTYLAPGVAFAVFGNMENDDKAFESQPVTLPLGPNEREDDIQSVARYYMNLTGAMAVGVKEIIPTTAEPNLFFLNSSR